MNRPGNQGRRKNPRRVPTTVHLGSFEHHAVRWVVDRTNHAKPLRPSERSDLGLELDVPRATPIARRHLVDGVHQIHPCRVRGEIVDERKGAFRWARHSDVSFDLHVIPA